jgi:hypothetical protein
MDGTEDHPVKQNKPHGFSDMQNLDLKKLHECKRRSVWSGPSRKEEGEMDGMKIK